MQFGLGVAAATWYFRSKERARRYELERGSSSTHGAPPCGPGWGWSAHRDLPSSAPAATKPVMQPASLAVGATAPQPVATPFSSQEEPAKSEIASEARRGWGYRWHRHSRGDASAGPGASGPAAAASGVTVDATISSDADDLQKLKQAVERLWMEKKTEATAAQERANEKVSNVSPDYRDGLADEACRLGNMPARSLTSSLPPCRHYERRVCIFEKETDR